MRSKTIALCLSLFGYFFLAYELSREQFLPFFGIYSLLFVVYFWLTTNHQSISKKQLYTYLAFAFLFRILFLFAEPQLSDDFWRYLWDGYLQLRGISPYAFTPHDFMAQIGVEDRLLSTIYSQLNSPQYYSVYPPVNQWVFHAAVRCFPDDYKGAVFMLHCIVLLLDCCTILLAISVLKSWRNSSAKILIYALNPLVIVELNGNLHTESTVVFLLISCLYLMMHKRIVGAAVCFGFAAAAKLVPLIFMPLIVGYLKRKKGLLFGLVALGVFMAIMGSYIGIDEAMHFKKSLSLYFASFEFNASFYYFLRYLLLADYWEYWTYQPYFMGIKWVESFIAADLYTYSKRFLQLVLVLTILYQTFGLFIRRTKEQFIHSFMLVYSAYFFLATTVHPWYICPLVLGAIFSPLRFVVVWSYLIACTYITYTSPDMQESLVLVFLEYTVVFVWFVHEIFPNFLSKVTVFLKNK